jgi:hypothetical protein
MKEDEFKSLDPLADLVNEACEKWLDSDKLSGLKEAMCKVSASLPATYSISVVVELRVYDEGREQVVNLLSTGLSTSSGGAPYRTTGDSTVHRYVVDGDICELPHDYCPHCWGPWDFKLLHPTCRNCGYSLGEEVKLLLDTDVCPHCEDGIVSATNLTCRKCGFALDPSFVLWG